MRHDEISHTITGKTEMHCRSLLIRAKKMMNQRGLIRFDRNFVLLRRKLLTNAQLKRLINKIEVDKDGNVDIYLRLIGELGLDETVLIDGDENVEEKKDSNQGNTAESKENRGGKRRADKKTTSDKTTPIRHNHT